MNNPKTNKRVEIAEHCDHMGNTVTCMTDVMVVAGKTSILFIPYWYVKLHRQDKADVVLFTNPMDWLAYMEQLKPIEAWGIGNLKDAYGASNPTFERMQWLTKEVEAGKRFVYLDMCIWATPPMFEDDGYTYHFSIGEKAQHRGFGNRMKRQWKTAIKPYLWDWRIEEGVSDESA